MWCCSILNHCLKIKIRKRRYFHTKSILTVLSVTWSIFSQLCLKKGIAIVHSLGFRSFICWYKKDYRVKITCMKSFMASNISNVYLEKLLTSLHVFIYLFIFSWHLCQQFRFKDSKFEISFWSPVGLPSDFFWTNAIFLGFKWIWRRGVT